MKEKKIYIIGSLQQVKAIKLLAEYYMGLGYQVRYVKVETDRSFEDLVEECFSNIEWADRIVAVSKPDGSYGQGVTYEMAFARFLGKQIWKDSHEKHTL